LTDEERQGRLGCAKSVRLGERGDFIVGFFVFVEALLLAVHFFGEEISFDGPQTALTPFGSEHLFDEVELRLAVGLELPDIGLEGFMILVEGFVGKHDAGGVEAVREGIHGGSLAALFGLGAVGFCAVGTGGIDFSL